MITLADSTEMETLTVAHAMSNRPDLSARVIACCNSANVSSMLELDRDSCELLRCVAIFHQLA